MHFASFKGTRKQGIVHIAHSLFAQYYVYKYHNEETRTMGTLPDILIHSASLWAEQSRAQWPLVRTQSASSRPPRREPLHVFESRGTLWRAPVWRLEWCRCGPLMQPPQERAHCAAARSNLSLIESASHEHWVRRVFTFVALLCALWERSVYCSHLCVNIDVRELVRPIATRVSATRLRAKRLKDKRFERLLSCKRALRVPMPLQVLGAKLQRIYQIQIVQQTHTQRRGVSINAIVLWSLQTSDSQEHRDWC